MAMGKCLSRPIRHANLADALAVTVDCPTRQTYGRLLAMVELRSPYLHRREERQSLVRIRRDHQPCVWAQTIVRPDGLGSTD